MLNKKEEDFKESKEASEAKESYQEKKKSQGGRSFFGETFQVVFGPY